MLARVSAFMGCLALMTLDVNGVVGCVTEATPIEEKCPTTASSLSFSTAGSCGAGGVITISTKPGLCAISVINGPTVGLPESGTFSGVASDTHYDIADGNWSLSGVSSDPAADPSTTQCTAAPATPGALTVTCNVNSCVPSGDDTGFQCSPSTCVMHLTPTQPAAADSGKPDAGADAHGD